MKAIQSEVVYLPRSKVYEPVQTGVKVKEGPVILRSAKGGGSGTVLTECKAFAQKLHKGTLATLEWWKCYLDNYMTYNTMFDRSSLTGVIDKIR